VAEGEVRIEGVGCDGGIVGAFTEPLEGKGFKETGQLRLQKRARDSASERNSFCKGEGLIRKLDAAAASPSVEEKCLSRPSLQETSVSGAVDCKFVAAPTASALEVSASSRSTGEAQEANVSMAMSRDVVARTSEHVGASVALRVVEPSRDMGDRCNRAATANLSLAQVGDLSFAQVRSAGSDTAPVPSAIDSGASASSMDVVDQSWEVLDGATVTEEAATSRGVGEHACEGANLRVGTMQVETSTGEMAASTRGASASSHGSVERTSEKAEVVMASETFATAPNSAARARDRMDAPWNVVEGADSEAVASGYSPDALFVSRKLSAAEQMQAKMELRRSIVEPQGQ